MVMRILLRPFALALSLTLLAASGGSSGASQDLDRIVSAEPSPTGIAVTVPTGGCTKKADFEVSSSPAGAGKATIELHRTKPDTCKGNFPDGLKLQYTWAELNLPEGTQLSVKNPAELGFGVQAANAEPVRETVKARHYRRGWHRHHRHHHFHKHRGHYCHCRCECCDSPF